MGYPIIKCYSLDVCNERYYTRIGPYVLYVYVGVSGAHFLGVHIEEYEDSAWFSISDPALFFGMVIDVRGAISIDTLGYISNKDDWDSAEQFYFVLNFLRDYPE